MRVRASRPQQVRGAGSPRFDAGIGLAVAFAVLLAAAALLGALRSYVDVSVGVTAMAGALAVLDWWLRPSAALAAAGLAWLCTNGLLVNRYAQLRWHGAADAVRLGIFFGVAVVVAATRSSQLALRRLGRTMPSDTLDETHSALPTLGDHHG